MSALSWVFNGVSALEIETCLRETGFEYITPAGNPDTTRFFDFPDLERIAEHGFGMVESQPPDSEFFEPEPPDPLEDIPVELREEFIAQLEACYLAYEDPFEHIHDVSSALQMQWREQLASIDSSPTVVAQFQRWRQCMTDGGRPVESHRGFFADLDVILLGMLDDWKAARAEDLAAAELYVACMTPLEEVRQPIRDKARQEFLEDNAEEVRAIQVLADRLILEVQQQ